MAKLLGDQLPPAALAVFGAAEPGPVADQAITMVTLDEAGAPHPGTASYAEIYAPDPGHLRVALWTNSSAARNLAARPKFALLAVADGAAYYIKGDAADLGADHSDLPGQHLFWVTLTSVSEDREPGFTMAPMRFHTTDASKTGWWEQLFHAVRRSTAGQ